MADYDWKNIWFQYGDSEKMAVILPKVIMVSHVFKFQPTNIQVHIEYGGKNEITLRYDNEKDAELDRKSLLLALERYHETH